MILERVKSKEEKLNEMMATKQDVESKMISFRAKEDRRVAEDAKRASDAAKKAEASALIAEPAPVVETIAEEIKAEAAPTFTKVIVTKAVEGVAVAPSEVVAEVKAESEMAEIAANANAALEAVDAAA
jgi:hypothetical protein